MKTFKSKQTELNIGDLVHGYSFVRNLNEEYEPIKYEGTIMQNFEDGSFIVRNDIGEEILVELYFNESINFIDDPIGAVPKKRSVAYKFKSFKRVSDY